VSELLEGTFSAEHSARLLRNYRYVVERAMRALGGWIALTPELSAKLLMGRHVWDLAQQCDAFGQRLPELRSRAQVSEAANPAVATFMDSVEDAEGPDQTLERLMGVYSVLKPHLLATYRDHLAHANPVYEPPTRRILARCIDDEERHIAAGETILKYPTAEGDRARERAAPPPGRAARGGGRRDGRRAPDARASRGAEWPGGALGRRPGIHSTGEGDRRVADPCGSREGAARVRRGARGR
jgi:hypothetical protein